MIITCPNCSTRYSLPQDKFKPGGQKVRCAKCGTVWYQEPEPLTLTAEEVVPPPTPAWSPATPGDPAPPEVPPNDPSHGMEAPAPETAAAETPQPPVEPAARDLPPDGFAQFHQTSPAAEAASGSGRKWALAIIVLVILALAALLVFKQEVQDLTGIQLVSAPAPQVPVPAAVPAAPPAPQAPQPLTLTFDEVESSIEEIDGIRKLMVKGLIVNPADHEQLVPALAFNMMDKEGKPVDRWVFAAPVRALAPHTTTRFSSQRDTPPTTLHELVPGFDVPENPPPVIEPPPGAAGAPSSAATPPATAPGTAAPAPKPPVPATSPR